MARLTITVIFSSSPTTDWHHRFGKICVLLSWTHLHPHVGCVLSRWENLCTDSRQSSRISSIMRPYMYSAFGEQLSGLVTIRAYQQDQTSTEKSRSALDDEGRFFYVIGAVRHRLCLRLDLLGIPLALGIAVLVSAIKMQVSLARLNVTLTYALQTTQASVHEASSINIKPCLQHLFSDIVVLYTLLEGGKTFVP